MSVTLTKDIVLHSLGITSSRENMLEAMCHDQGSFGNAPALSVVVGDNRVVVHSAGDRIE